MDNEKQQKSDWLDDILSSPDPGAELEADEQAVSAAGLSDMADMELEKIMQEIMAQPAAEPEASSPQPPVQDTEYRDDTPAEPEPPAEVRAEEPKPANPDKPVRKVRPKRKSGYGLFGLPHFISTAIWVVLIVFIGVSLGRLLWLCAADVLAFGREDQSVTLTITEHDTLDSITQKLYSSGLIRYPRLFKLYAGISHAEEKISVGTFTLNTLYDYHAVVNGLSATSSYRETTEVLIPEGYTCAQIFALLEERGVCSAKALEDYALENDFASYDFLEDVPRGDKYMLEGFLFPDTYEFYTNDTPRHVYIKFLSGFANHFDQELKDQIAVLNETLSAKMRRNGYDEAYIADHQMTLRDVMIVASMIERETAHTGENANIASVIYNRLTNPNYPHLDIDATLVYALGGKTDLTADDKKIDSPFNTYLYEGLPPTPISNPGLFSIKAALNPADTAYYFYALDPEEGAHHFSRTYEEHVAFLNSLN